MSKIISRLAITSALVSSLAIFGCSSSDDGGAALPAVPAGAVVITEANAKQVIADAIMGGSGIIDVIPVAAVVDQAPSARDIIDLVIDKTKTMQGTSVLSTPTGLEIDETCSSGFGTITGNVTETETSVSGTVTFTDCVEGTVTLNGTITFSASVDASGNWFLDIKGNLTGEESDFVVMLSDLHFNETGNDGTNEFSINIYQFSAAITGSGGFAAHLEAAIKGNEMETCPRSGIIVVRGSDNTRAKGTINSNGTVKIEFDNGSGTFTEVTEPAPGSPYPCTDFFV